MQYVVGVGSGFSGCLRLGDLVAQEREHLLPVPLAQFAVAFRGEVQAVGTGLAAGRGDDVGVGDRLRQLGDDRVHARAGALLVRVHEFAREQRHGLGLEVQVLDQVVVDGLHLRGPLLVAGVRLPLVQQDALDDARLLGQLPHLDQVRVGVPAVLLDDAGHPPRGRLGVRLVVRLVEQLDLAPGDRDVHDAHLDVLREVGDHRPAEVVGRAQAGRAPAQGGDGRVPVALLPVELREVDRGQDLEALDLGLVLLLDPREALHVGLPEAEEDVELRVRLLRRGGRGQPRRRLTPRAGRRPVSFS